MNFNQLVLEALSPIKVIKRLSGKEGLFNRLSPWIAEVVKKEGGWLVHDNDIRLLYFYDHGKLFRIDINHPLGDIDVVPPSEDEQVIKAFELKHSVNPSTAKAFNDLIDEL
jgi:hypothetical protein